MEGRQHVVFNEGTDVCMNKLVVVKWFSDSFMIRIESKRMLKKERRIIDTVCCRETIRSE